MKARVLCKERPGGYALMVAVVQRATTQVSRVVDNSYAQLVSEVERPLIPSFPSWVTIRTVAGGGRPDRAAGWLGTPRR